MTTPNAPTGDEYPAMLDIEIDRERLKRYLCTKRLLSLTLFLGFYGGVFGAMSVTPAVQHGLKGSALERVFLGHIGAGIGIGLACALLGYFLIARPLALRYVNSIKVAVENAFLHVCEHTAIRSDRKLHFRAIVDYATTQGALMRYFGIHNLRMTTTAGGMASIITIPGVKDCLHTRDMLSDIDRLRENS